MKSWLKYIGLCILLFVFLLYVWPEKPYTPYKADAVYKAQTDKFYVPDMPPDWHWYDFYASDGTRLRWGETGNRNAAKATIIWVPGYTATLEMYGEHFDRLARRGYHVIGLDLRGQGGSERHRPSQPEKLFVRDFGVYALDVHEWLDAQNFDTTRTVILMGSSFGGHVVTRSVVEYDLAVDGLYLIAPAFRPSSGQYSFDQAKWLMKLSSQFGKSKHYVLGESHWKPDSLDLTKVLPGCSSYPKRLYYRDVLFTRQPELRVGGVTNSWGLEFFESSELINKKDFLSQIKLPVTIISATDDPFVVTKDNQRACADYLTDCHEITIQDTGHCLPQENDAVLDRLFEEFDNLLKRIISKAY